ncbi:MAG: hypothetical protein PHG31_05545 [Candidatus Omnitrophica bacterium]|nr:hypothetical protein [Candidatus Omnitrophota bacterium]
MRIDRELRKLNEDLLKCCRLTQEVISKTSSALMHFDTQKIQEVIAYNKKIRSLCAASEQYFTGVIEQYQPEGQVLELISSGIRVNVELKQIAGLTTGIAAALSNLDTGIPDKYRVNIHEFVKIFQNIVWDSAISFLRKDAVLAQKTILGSLELEKICSRTQEDLLAINKTAASPVQGGSILLFIVKCLQYIAAGTVKIAEIAIKVK